MPESRPVGQPERSLSLAAVHAREARHQFIDLTHELPEDVPEDVLRLWATADEHLLAFVRRLEALRDA